MNRRTFLVGLLAVLAATPALADVAAAKGTVDAAKARGTVGEQADGYLGCVRDLDDPALQAAVDEINAGRAKLYAEVAQRYGVDPALVGASAFKQRFPSIPVGQRYRDAAGTWQTK